MEELEHAGKESVYSTGGVGAERAGSVRGGGPPDLPPESLGQLERQWPWLPTTPNHTSKNWKSACYFGIQKSARQILQAVPKDSLSTIQPNSVQTEWRTKQAGFKTAGTLNSCLSRS